MYVLLRYSVILSFGFYLPFVIDSYEKYLSLLKVLVAGSLVLGIVAILYSLPWTGSIVRSGLFQNDVLYQPREWVGNSVISEVQSYRATSLAGSPNVVACYSTVLWPISYFVYRSAASSKVWRIVSLASVLLLPISAVLTFSRSALLSLLLIVIVFLLKSIQRKSIGPVLLLIFSLSMIYYVAPEKYLASNRLYDATTRLLEGRAKQTDISRIESHTEPFSFVSENYSWFFAGTGLGARKMRNNMTYPGPKDALNWQYMHSFLGAGTHQIGLMPTFAILTLIFYCLVKYSVNYIKTRDQGWGLTTIVTTSVLCILVFFAVEHFFISFPRSMLFLMLTLSVYTVPISRKYI
ncbi:hypothetical protein GGP69_001353 [Salinibacter ruber]|nr:hypothetical protein [Salinibacter ruber]